jgi:DNA primase
VSLRDPSLDQRLEDIRTRYRVSDVVGRRTKLRRAGREWRGLCVFHLEKTPSFYVNDEKGFYHCFGCGAHGDAIRFVQESEGVDFKGALEMLDGASLPIVKPEEMAKARAEADEEDRQSTIDARQFWEEAGQVPGTPACKYLSWRRIFARPDSIRFGRVPSWKNPRTGAWNTPRPALLLMAENLRGEFVGIQRIFLTEDGGKADMDNPKLSLGRIRSAGGAVRFGRPMSDVIVTGGPEDGLTLFQRFGEMVTVYVSCGEASLPFLKLPTMCRAVTIARQNDRPGMVAANRARAAFREQGRTVREIAPKPDFKDWNDEERGLAKAAA